MFDSGHFTETKFISVPIINDSLYEVSETFTVALSSTVDGKLVAGTPSSVTVTITDNDGEYRNLDAVCTMHLSRNSVRRVSLSIIGMSSDFIPKIRRLPI